MSAQIQSLGLVEGRKAKQFGIGLKVQVSFKDRNTDESLHEAIYVYLDPEFEEWSRAIGRDFDLFLDRPTVFRSLEELCGETGKEIFVGDLHRAVDAISGRLVGNLGLSPKLRQAER